MLTQAENLVNSPLGLAEIQSLARAKMEEEQAFFDKKKSLPSIMVSNRQLRDTTDDAIRALQVANDPPQIFVRSAELVRIINDEDGRPIIKTLNEAAVRYYLSCSANYLRQAEKSVEGTSPPRDLVQNIMAAPFWPFPAIQGVVEVPVLRPDGSICITPGYDAATKLFYRPAPGLLLPTLPENPTQADAVQAANFIQDELLYDFPFCDEESKANTQGALLTPTIRHFIEGQVPAGVCSATKAGSGKTMLHDFIGQINTGRWAPMTSPPQKADHDAEWGKIIISALLKGSSIITFDNLEGLLRSSALASAITAKIFSGRILGLSKIIEVPVNVSFFINGNNLQLGGDLPRRCYWIRLNAKMSRPWDRKNFKHKDLPAWVVQNRGRLIAALLTMCKAWFDAGRPKPTTPKLGSFESWCDTVGGILQFAGVKGFLGNQETMYEISDIDGQAWEGFLLAWKNTFKDKGVLVKDLVKEIQKDDSDLKNSLPGELATALEKKGASLSRTLGWALPKKADTPFGKSGIHLVRIPEADPRSKASGWKVMEVSNFA